MFTKTYIFVIKCLQFSTISVWYWYTLQLPYTFVGATTKSCQINVTCVRRWFLKTPNQTLNGILAYKQWVVTLHGFFSLWHTLSKHFTIYLCSITFHLFYVNSKISTSYSKIPKWRTFTPQKPHFKNHLKVLILKNEKKNSTRSLTLLF